LGSLADLDGLLHHVDDSLHFLNDIIGFGGWVFDFKLILGAATGVTGTFMETVGEVGAASVVEVAMKEPKQIPTGLARTSAMLAGKTTPDRATLLHREFPITPTWRTNCQGVRPSRSARGRPKWL
jgi:hypothetical protein